MQLSAIDPNLLGHPGYRIPYTYKHYVPLVFCCERTICNHLHTSQRSQNFLVINHRLSSVLGALLTLHQAHELKVHYPEPPASWKPFPSDSYSRKQWILSQSDAVHQEMESKGNVEKPSCGRSAYETATDSLDRPIHDMSCGHTLRVCRCQSFMVGHCKSPMVSTDC